MSSIVVISGDQEIVDDNNSTFVSYSPLDAWEYSTVGPRYGNSYHGTTGALASVNFTFDGSYVAFYSDLNPDHGEFTVYLDGRPAGTGSSNSESFIPTQKLFDTTVSPGPHFLTIVNSPNGTHLGVDYFVYQPLTVSQHCSPTDNAHSPVHTDPSVIPAHGIPYSRVHLAIGLLCGLVIPLCCLVPSLFLLRTRKQLRHLQRELLRHLPATLDPNIQPFVPHNPPPYPNTSLADPVLAPGAQTGFFPHAKKAHRVTQVTATR